MTPSIRRLISWTTALAAAFALFLYAARALAAGSLPAAGHYAVDSAGSSVGFDVTNLVVTTVEGKFRTFAGTVTVGDSLATTHIDATADVASIDTASQRRDEHLRSPDFFDAARFPHMTFTSTMVWGTPDSFAIKGNLTIKGVTKEVTFAARILDSGVVQADAKIDRTDFGITSGPTIKNEVHLHLQIKLVKAS